MTIAVIGAGLAGLSAAGALHELGVRDLVVLERCPGPALETSFANGALMHPSLVEPWNSPGVLGSLMRNLGNEDAAALLRLRALPSLLGWGLRFARESSPERYLRNTRANLVLARYSMAQMPALRDSGLTYDHQARGSLVLFRNPAAQDAALAWAGQLGEMGARFRSINTDEAIEREPALAPIAPRLVGAIENLDDESGDAYQYCLSMAARLSQAGVRFLYGTSVATIERFHGRVVAVRTNEGERIPCDALVLAAASHSVALAAPLGISLPVRPAKGYSVTVQLPDRTRLAPQTPVIDPALHVAVVPVGGDRVRVAGTAEFCGFDRSISPARVANLKRQLANVYPDLAAAIPAGDGTAWAGLRPMSVDGVPLIGATRVPGLFVNTGHGHLGWTLAAGSGRLLADLLLGRESDIDPRPYAVDRFTKIGMLHVDKLYTISTTNLGG